MLHLYGIVEPHSGCSMVGIGGEPVVPVACGDVVAVASEHARPPGSTGVEEALWEHERVLEALLDSGPVLPVRFGVHFSDGEELRTDLQPRSAQLAGVLARVRGKVELGVRLLMLEDARAASGAVDTTEGPGARYLLERLGERREAMRKLEAVRARLAPFAAEERSRLLPRPGTPATAAFLVERHAVERFRREAQELERDLADVVLVCTGPWPPYNFVDEPPGATA